MAPRLAVAVAALLALSGAPANGAEPWEGGEPRLFVAGRAEVGLHGRVVAQTGWGQPHWAWAGVQGMALVTPHCTGGEVAIRGALPFLDLQISARRTHSFQKPLLAASASHAEGELSGGHAQLTVVDADLSGVVPVPAGLAAWEVEWVRPLDLPGGAHAFEETWQVALGPAGAGAFRLGWLAGPFRGRLRLGPFAEAVRLFGRDATVWRAGGALALQLGRHLSVVALGLAPIAGPDRFGTWTATYGTLALRYAFATGDASPGFP